AGIDLEAGVIREGRIEQPDTMGPADLALGLQLAAAADPHGCGGPLADAVHGEYHRLLEGGGKESGRSMALMVLGKQNLARRRATGRKGGKCLLQIRLLQ